MTILQPSDLPNWADGSPPAGTITPPSATERSNGFLQGAQAQITDFVIALAAASQSYEATVTIGATDYTGTFSSTTTSLSDIITGLAAALTTALSGQPVTVSTTANAVSVTANNPGQAFTYATTTPTYIAPTEVQANATNRPIRQYINWAFNLFAAWISFFFYAIFRWHDIGNNFDVLSGGTPPATTSGTLVGTSGNATSYITDRRAVGLSEAHPYVASRDTYVDLNRDGSWTYARQGAHGFMPADVAANARPQWKVVTDGTQITAVVDLRSGETTVRQPWSFLSNVALSGGNNDTAPLEITPQTPAGGQFSLLMSFPIPGGLNMRLYASGSTIYIALGCYWDRGTLGWFFDAGALADAVSGYSTATLWSLDQYSNIASQTKTVHSADGTTTWPTWDALQANFSGSLSLGSTLLDTAAHALLPRLLAFRPGTGVFNDVCLYSDGAADGMRINVVTIGLNEIGPAIHIIKNGVRKTDGTWQQGVAGLSTLTEIGGAGFATYRFFSGSTAAILDTDWEAGRLLDVGSTVTVPTATVGALTVSGAASAGSFSLATPASRTRVFPMSSILSTYDDITLGTELTAAPVVPLQIYKVSGYNIFGNIPIYPEPGEVWTGITLDGNGWATGGDTSVFDIVRIDTLGNAVSMLSSGQAIGVTGGAFHQAASVSTGGTVDPANYAYMITVSLGFRSVGHLYTVRLTYTKVGPT